MGFVEDIKWWQWMLISVLVGFILAFAHLSSGRVMSGPVLTPEHFEPLLGRTYEHDGKTYPFISNIRIYPALGAGGTSDHPAFVNQLVTFTVMLLAQRDGGHNQVENCSMMAPVPYIPYGSTDWPKGMYPGMAQYVGSPGDTIESICKAQYGAATDANQLAFRQSNPRDFLHARSRADWVIVAGKTYNVPWDPATNHTIVDFLRDAAAQGMAVNFRYAWWAETRFVYLLWVGGAFLIIGVLWPLTMHLMIREGLGEMEKGALEAVKPAKKKEKEKKKPKAPVAAPAAVKSAAATAGGANAAGGAGAGVPRKPAPGHYEGEYYPVMRPDEKK